ncbi:MAG: DUF5752 family protein [Desulfomonilaceae bacterium]|nr:DUF5752 family protein [Desulfomonilaceae bacterium]
MNSNARTPFAVKDCALVAIATGQKAQDLRELRDKLHVISPGSIYYHFWGGRLRPRFDDPQYVNDFATWTHYQVHDEMLAERLAIVDPKEFQDLESLRHELIEIVEQRLDEIQWPTVVPSDRQFHFIRSQIVVFDTGRVVESPEDLAETVPRMSLGSVFYHFIDARHRLQSGRNDFYTWLDGFGDTYRDLCVQIASIDPYFATLSELRTNLGRVFSEYFGRATS